MPFQLSLTTWWLLLGVLIGFVLFWLIDKLFRRDGEAAAQRELREIKKLKQQKADLDSEKNDIQKKLTDRTGEVKRLTTLSEDLRDSVRSQDQKVTNLETALAAAREQQKEDESLRGQLDDLQSQHQRLERDLRDSKNNVVRLNEEGRRSRAAIGEKDQRIGELEGELKRVSTQTAALEQAARDNAAASPAPAASAGRPITSSVTAAATAAAAAAAAMAGQTSAGQTAENEANKDKIEEPPVADNTATATSAESAGAKTDGATDATDHVIEPTSTGTTSKSADSDDLGLGSLASRHGGQSEGTDASEDAAQKPGLLDRLRGAFSGRRPDDLD